MNRELNIFWFRSSSSIGLRCGVGLAVGDSLSSIRFETCFSTAYTRGFRSFVTYASVRDVLKYGLYEEFVLCARAPNGEGPEATAAGSDASLSMFVRWRTKR